MRLLFEKGFAPTHAFSAFYRYLREDFAANAVLHFGTHGALEFMPGKQVGLSGQCWPDRLIGDLPNIYLYAANNPSEGTIAKRRRAATLVSYMTPPVASAGLYRGLVELKASLERWRQPLDAELRARRSRRADPGAGGGARSGAGRAGLGRRGRGARSRRCRPAVLELEYTLIPHGLHVVGSRHTPGGEGRHAAGGRRGLAWPASPTARAVEALVEGATPAAALAQAGLHCRRRSRRSRRPSPSWPISAR